MSDLTFSDTEQRIEGFQSRLRADYAAKIQEVAKLTDVVAKLQTRLLDVEHENNVLRQQFVKVKTENNELKKGVTTASEKGKSSQFSATLHSQTVKMSLKRERSPSLELIGTPERPPKKGKGKEGADSSITSEPAPSLQRSAMLGVSNADTLSSDSESDTTSESDDSNSDSSDSAQIPKSLARKWKELRNAKALTLPESLADEYSKALGKMLCIWPPALKLDVPRKFIVSNYGGTNNARRLLIQLPKNNPSGLHPRRAIFAKSSQNPSMPINPGDPGFFVFSCLRFKESLDSPWTLFHSGSFTSPKYSEWRYLGEYESAFVGKMSAECFRMHSDEAKQRWARMVINTKRIAEYRNIRARIALRLAFVIPLADKQQEESIIKKEASRIKKGNGRSISEDDIITAFSNGDEEVDIFRVHCVKYDRVFACDMQDRFIKYREALNREVDSEDNSDEDEEEDQDQDSDDDESDHSSPRPMPKPTASVSKTQNNSNVRSLVNNLQATRPKRKSPVSSDTSGSSSD